MRRVLFLILEHAEALSLMFTYRAELLRVAEALLLPLRHVAVAVEAVAKKKPA